MSGIEAVRKIHLATKIPVIILRTNPAHKLAPGPLTAPPFTYLQLPLKERKLELKLELALLRHRIEEQTRLTRLTLERRIFEITQELDSTQHDLQELQNQWQRDQASLRRFSDALDDSADSIYLIDRINMRFIDVNKTACERLGYSKNELLEMGPHDIKPYFSQQKLQQEFDRIAATLNRFGIIDTYHQCKNNEIYPVEVRLRSTEADGRPIIVAIARDMTLRYQNEQALRQSEEKLLQISKNLRQALWIRDIETRQVLYVTHAFEKIWGHSITQIYKDPNILLTTIHPEDRERIITVMQSMWNEDYCMDEEFRLLDSDKQIRWLRSRSFPIKNNEGKTYRIGGVTEDVTEKKINEEKLRLSEEKFHMLFECSPIGLALMNNDYRLTDVNPAFCNMLGYSQNEIIGKGIDDVTHPEDRNISMGIAENLFNGTTHIGSIEKRYLRKNGEPLWCKMHGTIVHDRDNRPLFALGMIENIDHFKRSETVRIAHETAQKKALVREVHHRIKNHLQGVVGLMQQHTQNHSQCSSIIELAVSQINAVATIHGLQSQGKSEDIELLQMLNAIKESIRNFFPASVISTIKVAGKNTVYLNRDETVPIALALNELLVNASKHGARTMEISLKYCNDHAIICIENQSRQTINKIHPGSGLELVRALLQTKGAMFRYEHTDQRFLAEIVLSPPVIQFNN
jgi:PAS domain S-box-containing protein